MGTSADPVPAEPMTVDALLEWAEGRRERYELADGRPYAMAPERVRHASAKLAAARALYDAIRRESLPCQALPDGVTVRINPTTAFEPDALVRCGPPLDGDAIEVPDPIVVVEILSPGTRNYDAGAKLAGYFTLPSIQHYLMIDPDRPLLVHHRREGEAIATRILTAGPLRLDPPGLELMVEDLLGRAG